MDKEKIKKALNHFENDEYTDAKEIMVQEIKHKKNEYLKDKLGLRESLNSELNEDDTENALKTLKAIIGSLKGNKENDIYKMAEGMMKSYEKNKGFSKDQAEWIYKTSKAMFK